ncbi:Coatomer subunit beta [Balamuthia mandrillaris]
MAEKSCGFLIHNDKPELPVNKLRELIESEEISHKIMAMQRVILLLNNGHSLPQLLMPIIRFIMPSKDKVLKKLLLLFWEVCEKTDASGKLLHEMILVCSHFRNDLRHANEYVRGATLRFLCKLTEAELLEPLIPAIIGNLEDKYSYVRRNAVLCIYSIYKNFPTLIPDAPDLIFNFIQSDAADASCKRNAFLMLFNCAQDKAVQYLDTVLGDVTEFGDILQLTIIELVRKVCRQKPEKRPIYLRCLFELLKSKSPAVQFDAAAALVSLTSAPTAIKAASSTFIRILCTESDNNVKMIVLDKLEHIKRHHLKVLQGLLMDIMRALASPSMDIRRKTLNIALDLVSPSNIDEFIATLKKEIIKTQAKAFEQPGPYRKMLIHAIRSCAVKYPNVASNVVDVLLEFLGDVNVQSAVEVAGFVREVAQVYPSLRAGILRKLLDGLKFITASSVFRAVLWIIGEYATTTEEIDHAFSTLKQELGTMPFFPPPDEQTEQTENEEEEKKANAEPTPTIKAPSKSSTTIVLADGTYATQSALTLGPLADGSLNDSNGGNKSREDRTGGHLRRLLKNGNIFLGSVLATTLTKIVLRTEHSTDLDAIQRNTFKAEVLLLLVELLKLGETLKSDPRPKKAQGLDSDAFAHISLCVKVLTIQDEQAAQFLEQIFLKQARESFVSMLTEREDKEKEEQKQLKDETCVQADDLLSFRQLRGRRGLMLEGLEDLDEMNNTAAFRDDFNAKGLRLDRLYQLTGLSDPVYAEAFVNVHMYDIILDVLVINQSPDTLQNLSLELATTGDLKLCERPREYSLGPFDQRRLKANVKVSSTEAGVIFGSIVYDIAGQATTTATDKNCINLNEIRIDIMDYIKPASCTDAEFCTMWSEFEWENKIAVNTRISDVTEYLEHIKTITNMNCLTSPNALGGQCDFISANLYARSIFGEDALANLSIEKEPNTGNIEGFIRIRSKTQGIALSLGDKINAKQRTNKKDNEAAQQQQGPIHI